MTAIGRAAGEKPEGSSQGTAPVQHDGDDVFQVRALSRGLRVLALFTVDHPEWSLSELSRRTGLHKATTYRMTRTMEAEGFLVFDQTTGRYHLGPATIPLSFLASSQSELVRIARPYLDELAEVTGETANLAVEVEGSVVVIGQVLTSHPFKPDLPLGRVMTDLANTHGKLFVAFKSEGDRARILASPHAKLTPNAKTDPVAIVEELAEVAGEGVAFDIEEHGLGICAVGAPVWDRSGEVKATLAVVAPKERFGAQEKKRHAQAVKRIAASFSTYLGYSGGT
jgi:IclR family acetate operon transcriptional repressor